MARKWSFEFSVYFVSVIFAKTPAIRGSNCLVQETLKNNFIKDSRRNVLLERFSLNIVTTFKKTHTREHSHTAYVLVCIIAWWDSVTHTAYYGSVSHVRLTAPAHSSRARAALMACVCIQRTPRSDVPWSQNGNERSSFLSPPFEAFNWDDTNTWRNPGEKKRRLPS